jgi:UDP-3-O-[3-hydroxymyristoyl] glucosamine N-acyltransferase
VADSNAATRDFGGEGSRVLTAEAIAAAVGGIVQGDASTTVSGVAPLDRADTTHLTFLANAKYAPLAEVREVGVLLVTEALPGAGSGRGRKKK